MEFEKKSGNKIDLKNFINEDEVLIESNIKQQYQSDFGIKNPEFVGGEFSETRSTREEYLWHCIYTIPVYLVMLASFTAFIL